MSKTFSTSKEARQHINKLLTDMRAIALKGFDVTSRSAFDKMQAAVDSAEADAQRLEAIEARSADLRSFERSPRPQVGGSFDSFSAMSKDEQRSRINKAFKQYAQRGLAAMDAEYRDLLTTSDASGAALIPQLFNDVLFEARRYFGPISLRVKQKVTDNNGSPLKISLSNDTANGLVLLPTEGSSSPAETDMTFSSKLLNIDTVSGGLIKVSVQEMDDSSFDLDSFIRGSFGTRYGRGLETAITTGKDSAGNVLPNSATGGLLGIATVGTTTATLADGIGWQDLVNTFNAVDPAYQTPRAAWTFNSSTRSLLLGQKDGFGRPLWTPDPTTDGPFSRLLGFDVVINQSMPAAGVASATPILFGSFEDAMMLRTDGQPTVLKLSERYMDELLYGFLLFTRIGSASLVMNGAPSPLVSLKLAAA